MCPSLPSPTLRLSGLEIELRLSTEVALCTLSLEDGQAWREGLALPGMPGLGGADLSRARGIGGFLWATGAVESTLLGVGMHQRACCPRHPQTRYLPLGVDHHFS